MKKGTQKLLIFLIFSVLFCYASVFACEQGENKEFGKNKMLIALVKHLNIDMKDIETKDFQNFQSMPIGGPENCPDYGYVADLALKYKKTGNEELSCTATVKVFFGNATTFTTMEAEKCVRVQALKNNPLGGI